MNEARHKTQDTRLKIFDFRFLIFDFQNRKSQIKNQKSETVCALCFILFILLPICVLGCYGVEIVKIKVKVGSKVDMKKYNTIAVMDFIDSSDNAPTDQGKILARMIRKQLRDSKEFRILDEGDMYLTLEEEIDKEKIEDPKVLASICDQLGANALIVGTFDFYQINQPVPYVVERYSPRTGRYSPETRTYIQRMYRLSFHARLVDGTTGETVFDYVLSPEERPEFRSTWGLPFSEGESDPTSLRSIAVRPVTFFALSLIPHYEYEQRILVR